MRSRLLSALVGAAAVLSLVTACSSSGSGSGADSSFSFSAPSEADVPDPSSSSATVPAAPAPKIANWKAVPSKYHVAYDVPPDWQVDDPDVDLGWEDDSGKPIFLMSGTAQLDAGYCPGADDASNRAATGVKAVGGTDLAGAASSVAHLAPQFYGDGSHRPQVTYTEQKTTILGGPAVIETATATGIHRHTSCSAPSAVLTVVAFTPTGYPPVVLIVSVDQGVAGSQNLAQLPQIFSTLRPLA